MKMFSKWELPVSKDTPAGVDIEYDSRFLELQSVAEGKPEQQYGETIIPAQEPDWAVVEKLCNQLLAESKDLRVLVYYAQALTAKYGLPGFQAGCEAIKINVDLFWDTLFPQLEDEDGEYDPFYRINALSSFSTFDGIAKELLASKLLVNGLTQTLVTVKEAVAVLMGTAKPELVAVNQALADLKTIQDIFSTKLKDEHPLNFEAVLKPLSLINDAADYGSAGNTPQSSENSDTEDPSSPRQEAAQSSMSNEQFYADAWRRLNISNRSDVDLALEKICVYFENFEPSHPAPLFIRRVQRLMNMDFYDIMKDISPESISNLEVLIGKSEDEGTSNE